MDSFILIYDDKCPICRGSADRVAKLDRLGVVTLLGLSEADRRLPADIGLPERERLHEEIHLITPDGQIITGAAALGVVARLFPRSRWLGKVIMLPGIRWIAKWVYRLVARQRRRLSRVLRLPDASQG
jgi:predicted DCC family thiol-disulfide oxidoreductase YuxK